jgi:hypothetical protein
MGSLKKLVDLAGKPNQRATQRFVVDESQLTSTE